MNQNHLNPATAGRLWTGVTVLIIVAPRDVLPMCARVHRTVPVCRVVRRKQGSKMSHMAVVGQNSLPRYMHQYVLDNENPFYRLLTAQVPYKWHMASVANSIIAIKREL